VSDIAWGIILGSWSTIALIYVVVTTRDYLRRQRRDRGRL